MAQHPLPGAAACLYSKRKPRIAWARVALEDGSIAGNTLTPFLTEGDEGYDINDEWDWLVAEQMVERGEAALPEITVDPFVTE